MGGGGRGTDHIITNGEMSYLYLGKDFFFNFFFWGGVLQYIYIYIYIYI